MPSSFSSTLILCLVIVFLPVFILLDQYQGKLWSERLFSPDFVSPISRHTPLITDGFYLPRVIEQSLTLTPEHSPIILSGQTRIPVNVSVTIQPGTTVVVHEYGGIVVEGTLSARGTAEQPITFMSNEQHSLNQLWNGVTFMTDSTGTLDHLNITAAAPAVTCQPNSAVQITHTHIQTTTLGFFTSSPTCTMTDSTITSQHDGVIGYGASPAITNTTIHANGRPIQEFPAP